MVDICVCGLGASAKWLQCFLDIFDFSKSSLSLSVSLSVSLSLFSPSSKVSMPLDVIAVNMLNAQMYSNICIHMYIMDRDIL